VLDTLRRELPAAFSAWTSGKYRATVEDGTAERSPSAGLVRVSLTRSREGACARATVGGNQVTFNVDRCGCGSVKIDPGVIWHEVGHTAGFWHVTGRHIMTPFFQGSCALRLALSAEERHHVRLAYERPPGNLDIDRDPASFAFLQEPRLEIPGPELSCR
jgi:hypothetical protein